MTIRCHTSHAVCSTVQSTTVQIQRSTLHQSQYENGHRECHSLHNRRTEHTHLHRLLAVAEHGYEQVVEKVVHHETGCGLDNRPDAMTLVEQDEHSLFHESEDTKLAIENGEPRLRSRDADPEALSAGDEW